MIPEFGHFALILALFLSCLQAFFPLYATNTQQEQYFWVTKPLSIGVTFFVLIGFLCLLYAFAESDFSVRYVVMHSNSALPLRYKLSGLWGGHEGSWLLWILLLCFWMLFFNLNSKKIPIPFAGKVLGSIAWLNIGFLLFLLFTSNPFLRTLPEVPFDGIDLNPLLQDPGLIFHPPLLYMGYVGSAMVAAFATAALWEKSIPDEFANWVRPYVLISFGFLTWGISWGSYWAYYELGWGGWWFWDPVENASFIPWLTLIAIIHSLIVVKKRGHLYGWTILLMFLCFAFSLLGTFLVRSGSLTSIHSFATDPKRGVFILLLFTLAMIGTFGLYAYRGIHKTASSKEVDFRARSTIALFSRENLLFFNTMLIVIAAASILLGTLFPLMYDVFTGKKISVGFPYFNLVFIPLMIPVLFSIPLGPFVRWGENRWYDVLGKMKITLVLSVIFAFLILLPLLINTSPADKAPSTLLLSALGLFCSFWVGLGTLQRFWHKVREGDGFKINLSNVSINAWGMLLAHFGIAVMVFGITMVSTYQIEKDLRLSVGESAQIRDHMIRFEAIQPVEASNYVGYRATFVVEKTGQAPILLFPEKRQYVVQNINLSETAIDAGFFRDIYIALGESLGPNTWTLRIYDKPFVRWIWAGALLIVFACVILVVFQKKKKIK